MHIALSLFLISFCGWTLAVHAGLLLRLEFNAVIILSSFITLSLIAFYRLLWDKALPSLNSSRDLSFFLCLKIDSDRIILLLLPLLALPAFMYWSWNTFWVFSIFLLFVCILRKDDSEPAETHLSPKATKKVEFVVIGFFVLAWVFLSLGISRSDLDDSFYAAVAAFASAHPENALKMGDPMLGEIGLPLIFPSYRYPSFELLSGAGGYLFSIPAINFYYIYLLPIWIAASVLATFLLTQELFQRHWLLAGCLALILTLLLGEMHRSPANFSFVRIFQGKAVFLSVIVPTIFYLTARFSSERGTKADLLLLACCQVASVGLTNFGMLMGPIAGFGALISNLPLAIKGGQRKVFFNSAVLLIPLPYLIDVALESRGSPILSFGSETAANVWTSVFGSHQQYLVGLLILAGPVLAKNTVTRWRMAVPSLLLFAIYLNPWLAGFISKYVTTPPVYWRVVWSFPILIFAAVSSCMIIVGLFERASSRFIKVLLSTAVLALIVYSLPFNTLRPENIGPVEGFATLKVPSSNLVVAQEAIKIGNDGGRLLAPDEIAGVISRFEDRPRLISTRGLYLDLMRPLVGEAEYMPRKLLYDFVTGNGDPQFENVRLALSSLDVSVIVLKSEIETRSLLTFLESEGFNKRGLVNSYSIWARRLLLTSAYTGRRKKLAAIPTDFSMISKVVDNSRAHKARQQI